MIWAMVLSSFFVAERSSPEVYRLFVESEYDTDGDGWLDCIQLLVFVPEGEGLFPTVLLANPYGMGTGNGIEDSADHASTSTTSFSVSSASKVSIGRRTAEEYCGPDSEPKAADLWMSEADHALIDILLEEGYAVAACAGPGTFGSQGWNMVLEEEERMSWNCISSFLSGERTAFLEIAGGRYTDAFWSDGRLLFFGHSYGGAIGLSLVQRDPDLFDAMILSAPVVDWKSWYEGALSYSNRPMSDLARFVSSKVFEEGELDAYQKYLRFLDEEVTKKEIWNGRSYLDIRPSCPVLLVQGVGDDVVGTASVYSLFSSLEKTGIPVSLVVHGMGHQFPLTRSGFDSFLFKWMDDALRTGEVSLRIAEFFGN